MKKIPSTERHFIFLAVFWKHCKSRRPLPPTIKSLNFSQHTGNSNPLYRSSSGLVSFWFFLTLRVTAHCEKALLSVSTSCAGSVPWFLSLTGRLSKLSSDLPDSENAFGAKAMSILLWVPDSLQCWISISLLSGQHFDDFKKDPLHILSRFLVVFSGNNLPLSERESANSGFYIAYVFTFGSRIKQNKTK